jgi:CheY-like chemotaxis protein
VRILLVEDNDLLANALRRVLKRRGGDVVRVVDGAAAREALETGDHFDIVLSDVDMPRLDGLGLLHWIRAHRSDLVRRCIFTTGEPDAVAAREIGRSHVHPVFSKPVDHESLFALIGAIVAVR